MTWSEIDFHPADRKLRTFGGLFLCFASLLGAWQGWAHERWLVAEIIFVASLMVASAGVFKVSMLRPLYVGMMIASFPIGWLTSHVLLATVYFILVTPLAVLFRCLGRDALRLRSSPHWSSYLEVKPAPTNNQAYFRPY
jgi:hypothetical protein